MNVVLAVVFLLGNAVFVGAQFSLITTRRDQVEPLAAAGNRRAAMALTQLHAVDRMLAGSQLGIGLCSLGLGAVAEPTFAHALEALSDRVSLPPHALHPVAFVLALAFVSFAHMVLGEMVPKNLALAGPLTAALWLAPLMAVWTRVTRPLLVAISAVANGVLRVVGVRPPSEVDTTYTVEDLAHLFDESAAEGLLDEDEQERLRHALALDALPVRELAVPMDRLVTLAPNATVADLEHAVATSGYSRYPIFDGHGVTGYVHSKDLLWLNPARPDDRLPDRTRRAMPQLGTDAPLTEALEAMQRATTHMALVVGKRGAPFGVVTLEDVLERLLGNPS